MNLVSPNVTSIRDESPGPQFATFKFDLCGPSYLPPLVRYHSDRVDPGFFVADVIVGATLDEERVAPFLRKCTMLTHLQKTRPFLPMLVADNFTPEAFRLCRTRGIMAVRPSTLFGPEVGRALGDLLTTLSNAAAYAAANPDRIESLFGRLMAIEGAAGNLRGALFELIVGHIVKKLVGGSIDMGFIVTDHGTGQSAEIDVRLVKEREVVIYECKGYQPSSLVSETQIKDWLEISVPCILAHHKGERRFHGSRFTFEFWTSGGFHSKALRLLRDAAKRIKKYEIAWKDGPEIRAMAQKLDKPGIKKILDEHYFNHPTAKLASATKQEPTKALRKKPPVQLEEALEDFEAAE